MSDNYIPVDTNLDVQSGFAFPSTSFEENGIPIVRMSDLKMGKLVFNNTKYVSDKWLKTASPFTLKSGDFLMGMSGSLTNFAFVSDDDIPSLLNQRVGRLKLKNTTVNYNYVCYWLKSEKYECYAEIQGEGAAQKNISAKQIGQFLYRDAPILEQNKIASILQTIDQTIEKTQKLIEKYQQIKAGLMHDLFTRGITADGKLRPPREQAPGLYQETPIGWIPKDWNYEEFGKKISVIDPNPSHRYPIEVPDGIPICSTENFYGEDDFIFKKSKLVQEATYIDQNNRCRFSINDVIFARKGKIGLARRYGKDKKIFSHTVVVMKPANGTTDSSWLLWLTRSDWLLKAIDVTMNTNSGVPTLGVEFIKNIEVPFPSKNEQINTTQKLDSLSNKIQIEIKKRDKLKKQKSGLMNDLLTGKVPVNIDEPEAVNA